MKQLEIHLNTGAVIVTDAMECSSEKDLKTQRITQLEWKTPRGAKRKLHRIDLDAIVCIVALCDD